MKKRTLLGALTVFVLVSLMSMAYYRFGPQTTAGSKQITIEVTYEDGTTEAFEVKNTPVENLKDAAATVLTLEGEEGPYGFTLYAINGHEANFETGNAYWAIYVNGEYGQYAMDQQPIADGDHFLFAYETT